uniref:Uncharacterized protein n=1 Tax=Aegilops tauschii subsp. strangulata TaxID=200361 RepID=A0A453KC65_AEGTS
DQFIFSPVFIGVFMSLLVTLEGKPSLVVPKLKQGVVLFIDRELAIVDTVPVFEFLFCPTEAPGSCC